MTKHYYANVFDVADLETLTRTLVGDWFDRDDIKALNPQDIDGEFIRIRGEKPGQASERADILESEFGVRVEEREEDV